MKMQARKFLSAALFGFVAVSTPALSQDVGWYAGFGIGQSSFDDPCPAGFGITSCDDSDTSWKIFGGYQFNTNWGVEFGYVDLGKISFSGPGFSGSADADGLEVVGVGTYPINPQFSIYGKLGLFNWDASANVSGFGASDSGTDLTLGFGVQYKFTKNLFGRAEWQHYDDVDVDVLGISIVFKF